MKQGPMALIFTFFLFIGIQKCFGQEAELKNQAQPSQKAIALNQIYQMGLYCADGSKKPKASEIDELRAKHFPDQSLIELYELQSLDNQCWELEEMDAKKGEELQQWMEAVQKISHGPQRRQQMVKLLSNTVFFKDRDLAYVESLGNLNKRLRTLFVSQQKNILGRLEQWWRSVSNSPGGNGTPESYALKKLFFNGWSEDESEDELWSLGRLYNQLSILETLKN